MSNTSRRLALGLLLSTLAVGPAFIPSPSSAVVPTTTDDATATVPSDGPFPHSVETAVAGKPTKLQLTGTAFRKTFGIKFYQIAGYCDANHNPINVDALAAADVPKQLILILERDISENILRRSFEAAFTANDPEQKFGPQIKTLLDYLTAAPLKKGARITLTHLPAGGVECRVAAVEPLRVAEPQFAHVVWNVYMGPKGVCPVLRAGLGTRLVETVE